MSMAETHTNEPVLLRVFLVEDSAILRDIFACTLSNQTLKESKESLGAYLGRIGAPKGLTPAWSPPPQPMTTDVATIINMGYPHV